MGIKREPTPGLHRFNALPTVGCDGKNELGIFLRIPLAECTEMCLSNPACVSFEWYESPEGEVACQLSKTCFAAIGTPYASPSIVLYEKRTPALTAFQVGEARSRTGRWHPPAVASK